MKKNTGLVAILLCVVSLNASGQQFSGWLADFNTIRLNSRLSVHSDFQVRSGDKLQNVQTLLLRGGLNYHINKRFIVTGGYALVHNRRTLGDVTGYANEHRIWEQFIFNHGLVLGKKMNKRTGTMQHRLRIEQRFLPQSVVVDSVLRRDGSAYANRLRYFFRNVTPVIPWSSSGSAPFVAIQNEIFVNIGDKSPVNGKSFDQNRFYVALGYRFNKSFDLEAGYMNQYINGAGNAFTNNHIIQLAGYVRL